MFQTSIIESRKEMIIVNTTIDKIIELDNNYYLKINNSAEDLINDVTNVENISLNTVLKNKKIILKIDFNTINKKQYNKILKKLLFLKRLVSRNKTKFGTMKDSKILLGYVINYNIENKDQNDFIIAINAAFYNTKYERYNYIYDTVCNYLDSFFYGKNLCDFKNNKCGEKRNTSSDIGCCHHYKNKLLGPLLPNNLMPCEHLKEDHTCDAKCIGCKLFTCGYLEKKGIKFRIKDILLLNVFFNPLQKYFIKTMVFTPKEKVIKKLMRL